MTDKAVSDRLVGTELSPVTLMGTDGNAVSLDKLSGCTVIYIYPRTSPRSTSIEAEPPQHANSHVTACKTTHVCNDAQACGRVAELAGMVNQRGDKITARWMISGLALNYLN